MTSTTPKRTIHKVTVHMDGDFSAGIHDTTIVIGKDGDCLFEESDMVSQNGETPPAEEFRAKIAEAFECVWGEKPEVRFDIEIDDESARLDAMIEREEVWLAKHDMRLRRDGWFVQTQSDGAVYVYSPGHNKQVSPFHNGPNIHDFPSLEQAMSYVDEFYPYEAKSPLGDMLAAGMGVSSDDSANR